MRNASLHTALSLSREDKERRMPRGLQLFLCVALALNMAAAACEVISRFVLHLVFPYDTPVLYEAWGVDLSNYTEVFRHVHSPLFFETIHGYRFQYPAPVAPFYGFFLSFSHPVAMLETTLVGVLLCAAAAFGLYLYRNGLSLGRSVLVAGGALVLSYPVGFELKQGNTELFVCLSVGLGVWSYVSGRLHLAAALFAVAGAMKVFPFVYLGLFLAQRRYRPLFTAIVTAAIVTTISLWYVDPSLPVAWHGIQAGVRSYQAIIFGQLIPQTSYDHSLFVPCKLLLRLVHHNHNAPASAAAIDTYLAIVALGGVVLFFTRIRKMPVINQVLCLCVASILLPPSSFDYTLVHLYVPLAMLIGFALSKTGSASKGLAPLFFWFAVATSVQTELIWRGHSLQGLVKTLALCSLMVLALRHPFESDRPEEEFAEIPIQQPS